jgi:hypothetical protein
MEENGLRLSLIIRRVTVQLEIVKECFSLEVKRGNVIKTGKR